MWDFLFEATCSEGANRGKKLSRVRKFYHAPGHWNGDDFPKGSFTDPPSYWPDYSNPYPNLFLGVL